MLHGSLSVHGFPLDNEEKRIHLPDFDYFLVLCFRLGAVLKTQLHSREQLKLGWLYPPISPPNRSGYSRGNSGSRCAGLNGFDRSRDSDL